MFGAEPRLPVDFQYPTRLEADPKDDYANALERRLIDISEKLIEQRSQGIANLHKAQGRQKAQYDAKHQGTYYDVGDEVKCKM